MLVVGFVGAFLSLCQQQLPPYSRRAGEFRARGVDSILGVAVNDHAVLKSFAQSLGVGLDLGRVGLVADHDGSFVRALDLAIDLNNAGMGWRAKRFAMLVREGFVEQCWVEDNPGELDVSSAESVLQRLPILPAPTTPSATAATATTAAAAATAATSTPANACASSDASAPCAPAASSSSSSAPLSTAASVASSTAEKVVAAVRGLSAAVADRLDGTTDASEAIKQQQQQQQQAAAAAVAASTAASAPDISAGTTIPQSQLDATAASSSAAPLLSEQQREEAAARAAADIRPPGQA